MSVYFENNVSQQQKAHNIKKKEPKDNWTTLKGVSYWKKNAKRDRETSLE